MPTSTIPYNSLNDVLERYHAKPLPEYSNTGKHVYYVRALRRWIIVRRQGDDATLEFVAECPCEDDD